jgi:hypothetical protein
MDLANFAVNLPIIGGFNVRVSDLACVKKEWKQYKFPKTKKTRIRKKWRKRTSNFRLQEVHCMVLMKDQNTVVVSQKTFDKIKTSNKFGGTQWT